MRPQELVDAVAGRFEGEGLSTQAARTVAEALVESDMRAIPSHGVMLVPYFRTNFYTMTELYQDVANGTLPAYAFIEPRMLYNNNDYHPPAPLSPWPRSWASP